MKRHRSIKVRVLVGLAAACLLLVMAGVADAELVAHWSLDDGQSDPGALTATDSVAPAADGTWEQDAGGGPIPRWVPGIVGGAAEFGGASGNPENPNQIGPGTDDVISIPGDGKLDITGALTLATWIRLEDLGGRNSTRHIVGKDRAGGASQDAYSLKHDLGGFGGDVGTVQFLIASTGINVNLASSMTLEDYTSVSQHDGWVHVAGVFEPGQFMRLYIDGALDAELLAPFVPAEIDSFPTTPFNIGRLENSTTHSFNGRIDDVRVFDEALTQEQIAALIAAPVVPGDFDGDGDVDGADFVIWQTNFPTETGATLATGDADGDGDVDGADFVIWQTNFPFTPSTGVTPVPEPQALILVATGAVAVFATRRRR